MTRLMVPTIGTRMTLTSAWTFALHHEYRNSGLVQALGLDLHNKGNGTFLPPGPGEYYGSWSYKTDDVTLPAGTVLRVDRLYIRKNQADFDSITFVMESCPLELLDTGVDKRGKKKKLKYRFWVKLYDANTIECDIALDTLTR